MIKNNSRGETNIHSLKRCNRLPSIVCGEDVPSWRLKILLGMLYSDFVVTMETMAGAETVTGTEAGTGAGSDA